jgi:hypothetical protein
MPIHPIGFVAPESGTVTPPPEPPPVEGWEDALSSGFAANIRAAYDFRQMSGGTLAGIVGPSLVCDGLTPVSAGAQFTKGVSQAYSNATIAVSYPFTLVYYGKTTTATGGDSIILSTQPTKWSQTSNTNALVFARTFQGILPYNGSDNNSIPHVASTEDYFVAFSFLGSTVRYAVRKQSGNLNGTRTASASSQSFNGFVGFGAGLSGQRQLTGTLGYALFIQQAFSTEGEMDSLYATLPNNFVW